MDDLEKQIRNSKNLQRIVALGKAYEKHMLRLLKALVIVRKEAHYINLITREDWEIASRYNVRGFFGRKTNMIVKGCDISEFAHLSLVQLAGSYPELFKASGIDLDPLPDYIDGEGDGLSKSFNSGSD